MARPIGGFVEMYRTLFAAIESGAPAPLLCTVAQAFEVQRMGLGFSMVELLSSCPTNWGIPPEKALDWIKEHMVPAFPLGDYKVHPAVAAGQE